MVQSVISSDNESGRFRCLLAMPVPVRPPQPPPCDMLVAPAAVLDQGKSKARPSSCERRPPLISDAKGMSAAAPMTSKKKKGAQKGSQASPKLKSNHQEAMTKEQIKMEKLKEISKRLASVLEESRAGTDPLAKLVLDLQNLETQVDYGVVEPSKALPGSSQKISVAKKHYVLGSNLEGPWPAEMKVLVLATGCFWGTEKGFWRLPGGGIYSTAVGYAAGYTPNPTYEEVCTGRTGATEAVQVIFNPEKISLVDILRWFWESHDPTQGMRQGNDRGSQYRSGLYYFDDEQKTLMEASKAAYQQAIRTSGRSQANITTEIRSASEFQALPGAVFFYAENDHQQYLAKPRSRPYCSAEPLRVSLPPFQDWRPSPELAHHAPKLSEAFWRKHAPKPGSCVKAPHEPIEWHEPT